MRLEKIKLAGFKSFVDPTTVPMPSNLVGIVGPNGCGKSNVIDAVRWVMGESSAKMLRGESMADVIFNGSNSRKPVGTASIELVFDNADGAAGGQYAQYSQISVRRQVSRDGQSSYFLNGVRCRRRDIADLFLGTGLGPWAGALAIGLDSVGTLGKLSSEEIESIDRGPVEAVSACGGGWASRVRWGVLPQVMPSIMSYWFLRFEINVRASAVLGLIGAGGIGSELISQLNFRNFEAVGAVLIVTIVAVIAIDTISGAVRSRIIAGSAGGEVADAEDEARNLELFRSIRHGGREGSFFEAVDRTVTAAGGRLLRDRLERPLLDLPAIERRQGAVRTLLSDATARAELREALGGVHDVERLLGRAVSGASLGGASLFVADCRKGSLKWGQEPYGASTREDSRSSRRPSGRAASSLGGTASPNCGSCSARPRRTRS